MTQRRSNLIKQLHIGIYPGRSILALPFLLLIVMVVFVTHIDNGYVFDDHKQIVQNPYVRGDVSWTNAFTEGVWTYTQDELSGTDRYYRPVFTLVNRILFALGDGSSVAFHLFNLLVHMISVVLAYLLLRRQDFVPAAAMAAVALFALHPLVGETIYWASSSSDLILLLCLLVTLFGMQKAQCDGVLHKIAGVAMTYGALFIGLLSKEAAVVIAPLLTLNALRYQGIERWKGLLFSFPAWLLTAGYLSVRSQMVESGFGSFLPDGLRSIGHFGAALGTALEMLVFPWPLTIIHPFPVVASACKNSGPAANHGSIRGARLFLPRRTGTKPEQC